jgi:hypothetical protein
VVQRSDVMLKAYAGHPEIALRTGRAAGTLCNGSEEVAYTHLMARLDLPARMYVDVLKNPVRP